MLNRMLAVGAVAAMILAHAADADGFNYFQSGNDLYAHCTGADDNYRLGVCDAARSAWCP